MKTLLLLALIAAVGSSIGCNSGDDDDAGTAIGAGCNTGVPQYEDVAMFDKCTMCHASDLSGDARMQAPKDINFDTEAAARTNSMKALHDVMHSYMPPASSGITLTSAEKNTFYQWAMCAPQ